MGRFVFLDSEPLSLACDRSEKPDVIRITNWLENHWINGSIVVVPEIVDYEVRRKLIHVKRAGSLRRLDELCDKLSYCPIKTEAMKQAALIWAEQRWRGRQTADNSRLDADVILVAQALTYCGEGDLLTVATGNVAHISSLGLDARNWDDISE